MMPEAVNDVCMPSVCFHERIFSSKFGDNISLVWMSWQYKFIGRYKNIALKMLLSPGNSLNFYLQKSITRWEPSFIHLWKLTSIYIFKLGISHYVLIGASEVIHISTVTLAFSVLFLLAHIKNNLPIFYVFIGSSEVFQVSSL